MAVVEEDIEDGIVLQARSKKSSKKNSNSPQEIKPKFFSNAPIHEENEMSQETKNAILIHEYLKKVMKIPQKKFAENIEAFTSLIKNANGKFDNFYGDCQKIIDSYKDQNKKYHVDQQELNSICQDKMFMRPINLKTKFKAFNKDFNFDKIKSKSFENDMKRLKYNTNQSIIIQALDNVSKVTWFVELLTKLKYENLNFLFLFYLFLF
jgi:hypothetical protein